MVTGSEPTFDIQPSEFMDMDNEIINEEHKSHMDNIKSLLEKEPKLKDDIKKIIVDQLVKAKIHPEQYNKLKN